MQSPNDNSLSDQAVHELRVSSLQLAPLVRPGVLDYPSFGDTMTSYSVASTGDGNNAKHAIFGTWPGRYSDRSVKVTTLTSEEAAGFLAWELTALSENAWHTRTWLSCADDVEAYVTRVVRWLRTTQSSAGSFPRLAGESRHTVAEPYQDLKAQSEFDLKYALEALTQTQRHAIADELVSDADEREKTVAALVAAEEPEQSDSRFWQALHIGRSSGVGASGPDVLDAAPAWLEEYWPGPNLQSHLWAARSQLLRLEQLAAACEAAGGKARVEGDPVQACCETREDLDAEPPTGDRWTIYPAGRSRFHFYPNRKVVVSRASETLQLDVDDDDGFAAVLGEWTRGAGGAWWVHTNAPATAASAIEAAPTQRAGALQ